MTTKRQLAICIVILSLLALPAAALIWLVRAEKSMPHSSAPQYMTAYYWGLGLNDDDTILGYQWTRVESDFGNGRWIINCEVAGYREFTAYYPDGTLLEEGTCLVEMMDFAPVMPFPDYHDVKNSKCYAPDGTVIAEVSNGTGVQRHCHPNGTVIWELHLEDYTRTKLSMWYPDGQLQLTHDYIDGWPHGPYTSYHPNGQPETIGAYERGRRVGTWTRYDEDGNVTSVEKHDADEAE